MSQLKYVDQTLQSGSPKPEEMDSFVNKQLTVTTRFLRDRWNGFATNINDGTTPIVTRINVRDYGAVGDGVTDDTAAIQDAMAAALALSGGSEVWFPEGEYLMSSGGLTILSNSTGKFLRLRGTGYASHIISQGNEVWFYMQQASNVWIEDLRVTGDTTRTIQINGGAGASNLKVLRCFLSGCNVARPGGAGGVIYLDTGASDVEIAFNKITDFGFGSTTAINYGIIGGINGPGNDQVFVHDNTLINRAGAAGALYGIGFFSCSNCRIIDNYIDMNNGPQGTAGIADAAGYGIFMYNAFGEVLSTNNGHVCGNTILNTAGLGIYVQSIVYTEINDNKLINTCQNMADISLPTAAISVNCFYGHMSITGNVISTSGKGGYALYGRYISVSGGTVENCKYGVKLFQDNAGTSIEGVHFINCTRGIFSDSGQPNTIRSVRIMGNTFHGAGLSGGTSIDVGISESVAIIGNYIYDAGLSGISILEGSRNIIARNHVCIAQAYGIDNRCDDTHVCDNITVGCTNAGISNQGSRNRVQNNDCYANGTPATLTGTVDLTTITYPSLDFVNAYCFFGNELDNTQLIRMPLSPTPMLSVQHLLGVINSQAYGFTASLDATNHLILRSSSGGTGSTMRAYIDGGADPVIQAATLALIGIAVSAATGTGPSVAELNEAGTDTYRRGNRLTGDPIAGTDTLVGGTVTVATAEIKSGDQMYLSRVIPGGVLGHLSWGAIDSTSFTITSDSAFETSDIQWEIVH